MAGLVAHILGCISDDKLQEVAFSVHFKGASILTSSQNTSEVYEQLKYSVQVLWELFVKSSHSLRQSFARYTADEPHLTMFTLKEMRLCLESYGRLKFFEVKKS